MLKKRVSGAEVGGKDVAKALEAGVDEEADVAGGEAGDPLDFLIAETLLEFEDDDFALVGGEAGKIAGQLGEAFLLIRLFIRLESRADDVFPLVVIERLAAIFLTEDVERAIPA